MAKVRKARREEREQRHAQLLRERAREEAVRRKRRDLWRRLTFHDLRHRGRGRLFARRSPGERAFAAVTAVLMLVVIWNVVPSVAMRVALSLLFLLALPVLVIVAFDRRNS